MNPLTRLLPTHTTVNQEAADRLANPEYSGYIIEVRPPDAESLPASLDDFIDGVREIQSKWLGLSNASPSITFEIIRPQPGRLRLQFSVPTKRLDRKLRGHLHETLPELEFTDGKPGLPIDAGNSLGGGYLSLGRADHYPLKTELEEPATNAVVSTLHPDAMRDTEFVLQLLFRPIAGHPLRRRLRIRRSYKQVGFLKKEDDTLWGSRPPTKRERKQADLVEQKAANTRYYVSIRFLAIGAKEYTLSRLKELVGPFNRFESSESGQYLDLNTVRSISGWNIHRFANAVADRRFGPAGAFHATPTELAALVTLPDRTQENLQTAQP